MYVPKWVLWTVGLVLFAPILVPLAVILVVAVLYFATEAVRVVVGLAALAYHRFALHVAIGGLTGAFGYLVPEPRGEAMGWLVGIGFAVGVELLFGRRISAAIRDEARASTAATEATGPDRPRTE